MGSAVEPGNGMVVWVLSDGRPGHRTQLQGLLEALSERRNLEVCWVPLLESRLLSLWELVRSRYSPGDAFPRPKLLLAAGHGTHLSLLTAARATAAYSVVLMKPSLPLALFDLVVAPRHDNVAPAPNLVATRGVLNRVRWSSAHDESRGLILIGGPSRHHAWDDTTLVDSVAQIVARTPSMDWLLSTSPRTPAYFLDLLRQAGIDGLEILPFRETPPDWLPQTLSQCGVAWVTEDSVSMVYEALSSGAGVGILPVPRLKEGRVVTGLDELISEGLAAGFEAWKSGRPLPQSKQIFNEASRVAAEVISRSGL